MAFVKLDCGILDSSLWIEPSQRMIFITALLMAEPHEVKEPIITLDVFTGNEDKFIVPAGWYGFIRAASLGIVQRAGLEQAVGLTALESLCGPDSFSRSPDFEGRRMARVTGGFLILNYQTYRDKDHTVAERQRRYRARQALRRNITQGEAEVEVEVETKEVGGPSAPRRAVAKKSSRISEDFQPSMQGITVPADFNVEGELSRFRDYWISEGKTKKDWQATWRMWVNRAVNEFGNYAKVKTVAKRRYTADELEQMERNAKYCDEMEAKENGNAI